jgi:cytochrome c peroxidase
MLAASCCAVQFVEAADLVRQRDVLGLPSLRPIDTATARLGESLFFEPSLSSDGNVSCATCHQVATGFADRRALSVGVTAAVGRRNAPTLLNAGVLEVLGWDGRANSLETVILEAMTSPEEMAVSDAAARATLTQMNIKLSSNPLGQVASAIAEFVRQLNMGASPADQFLFSADDSGLGDSAITGFNLFFGKAHCSICHTVRHPRSHPFGGRSALYTDQRFHNLGMGDTPAAQSVPSHPNVDLGRADVTGEASHSRQFRTPTLRNVALTAPYMHDGRFQTLDEVVDFYSDGGGPDPGKDPMLRPLKLTTQEKQSLVAFLESLTGDCSVGALKKYCAQLLSKRLVRIKP